MSVYYVLHEDSIHVKGKTYPYRETMRALGAQYNSNDKSWSLAFTPSNLERIGELCRSVGGGPSKEPPAAQPRVMPPDLASPGPASTTLATVMPQALARSSSAKPPALERSLFLNKEESSIGEGFSIAELMRQAQLAIAQSFPRSVWVIGEIQNIRIHASGTYFQLADTKEGGSKSATVTVNATLWKSQHRDLERKFGPALNDILQDGFRVRVLADLTLFKDRGQLSLQIQSIDPNFTKGSLALAREKLLKELRSKGLDQKNKALSLTAFPFVIGLLSAEDSRAKSDFIDQLTVYGFPGDVVFFPSQMQGESTLVDVVRGIAELQRLGCDLIVVTRGGGSAADLRWFDSPEIAYAIAGAKVPILAAIGHHEDVCVAEDICFQREKTPTAAADFIIAHFQKSRDRIEQAGLVLGRALNDRIKLFDAQLAQITERMRTESQSQLNDQRRLTDQAEATLELHWQRRVLRWTARLQELQSILSQSLGLRLTREEAKIEQAKSRMSQGLELSIRKEATRLDQARSRLHQGLALRLGKEEARIEQQRIALHGRSSLNLERAETKNTALARDLRIGAEGALKTQDQGLERLIARIQQRDPQPWLLQGWTQLFDDHGPIREGVSLQPGQDIKARLLDSLLELTVRAIKPLEKG